MMYRLFELIRGIQTSIIRLSDGACVPCDPNNKDYEEFKSKINNCLATLEDSEGNLMSAKQAKDCVSKLP